MNRVMWWATIVIVSIMLGFLLTGCAPEADTEKAVKIVEVSVPVPVMPEVPSGLQERYKPDLPTWGAPSMPGAAVCLTVNGAEKERGLIYDLVGRDEAWRALLTQPAPIAP